MQDMAAAAAASADAGALSARLRVTEIFRSLQGEGRYSGWPTVFVRLTGCPLRCQYCDTAYAFHGGRACALQEVLDEVGRLGTTRHVCVTGGEPLAQPAALPLLQALCDQGYEVSLETSGALDISRVDARVSRVVDIKTPGSGECARNRLENLAHLTAHDQIKFVICDRADFDWAASFCREHALAGRCDLLFSPSHEQLPAGTLADWLLASGLQARFQIQLHKSLWGNEPGR